MRPKIMMGGAMYIRMRGVDLIILCLKICCIKEKIGPNTLSCMQAYHNMELTSPFRFFLA